MAGSISRIWRHIRARNIASTMLLAIVVPMRPDPIAKRGGGTAVMLPIPGPTVTAPATGTRIDPIAEPRRDARADRGRVLYAAGRAPRDTAAAPAPRAIRKPCIEQRVGQGRATTSPNS
jgi:hypothetical protein